MAFVLTSLAAAVPLRCVRAGVVCNHLDRKPQPGGSRECCQLEIMGRGSPKPLTLGTPHENKVGVAAATQSGVLKPGKALPLSVPLAFTEFHDHIRFKII